MDKPTTIAPTSFKVDVLEWTNKKWNKKKFIRVTIRANEGDYDLILWPDEANCLKDMLEENLMGMDISYGVEQAYNDILKSEK